jgi:hypothetical protein
MSFALPQLPWITLSIQAKVSCVGESSFQRVLKITERYVAGADLRYRLEPGNAGKSGHLELVPSPADWMIAMAQSGARPAVIYHFDETVPVHIGLFPSQELHGDQRYRLNIAVPRSLELQTSLDELLFDICEALRADWGRYLPLDMQAVVLDVSGRGSMKMTKAGLKPLNSHLDLLAKAPWLASLVPSTRFAAGGLVDEVGWKNYLSNDIANDVMADIKALEMADSSLVRKGDYGVFFSFGHRRDMLENQMMAMLYISVYKRIAFGTRRD